MEFDTNSKRIDIEFDNQIGRSTPFFTHLLRYHEEYQRFNQVLYNILTSFSSFPSNCVCISLCLLCVQRKGVKSQKPEMKIIPKKKDWIYYVKD